MSAGFERAIREQQREAQRVRERAPSGVRRAKSADLPMVAGSAPCARCGEVTPRADLLFAEVGPVCLSCDGEHALVPASAFRHQLGVLAIPVPTFALPALLSWAWAMDGVGVLAGKGGAGWLVMASIASVLALVTAFVAARALRDALKPSLDGEPVPGRTLAVGLAGLSVTATVGALVWSVVLVLLPFL